MIRTYGIYVLAVCCDSRISRDDGRRLRDEVEKHWDKWDVIIVDFSNKVIASLGFLDEGIGVLALKYSLEEIRQRLRFENINEQDRDVVESLLLVRSYDDSKELLFRPEQRTCI